MSLNKIKVVVILNAPRSGSSALGSSLVAMGLAVGNPRDLLPADEFNPEGYFEKRQMMEINDRLMALGNPLTLTADLARAHGIPDDEIKSSTATKIWIAHTNTLPADLSLPNDLERQVLELVSEAQNSSQAFVWKDPRLCFTLPVWQRHIDPVCIILVRHPVEAAQSNIKMASLPQTVCEMFWSICTRNALKVSENLPRIFVRHEDLMSEPATTLNKISEFLTTQGIRLTEPASSGSALIRKDLYRFKAQYGKLNNFLDPELLTWFETGCTANPPAYQKPFHYPTEAILLSYTAHHLFNKINQLSGFVKLNENLRMQNEMLERKMGRIRKIPFYLTISKFLKLLGI